MQDTSSPYKTLAAARLLREKPWLYFLLVCALSALLSFAMLEVFRDVTLFNSGTQIRPASALGPVLGLFFGPPGIIGCAVGNLLSDVLHESSLSFLAYYFVCQLIYNALPYLVWYLVFRKRTRPFPCLDQASKVALYMLLAAISSVLVVLLLMPFSSQHEAGLNTHLIRVMNNFLFLIFLGIPLLILLERLPLVPLTPWWIKAEYCQRHTMNLTQRAVFILNFAAAFLVLALVMIAFTPHLLDGDSFAEVINSMYSSLLISTLFCFTPLLFILHAIELRVTKPIEILTSSSKEFVDLVARRNTQSLDPSDLLIDMQGTKPRYEIGELVMSLDKMRLDTTDFIHELTEATAERERSEAELSIAKRIQESVLPKSFKMFNERYHLDVAAFIQPAREVGGDFYDIFEMSDGRVGFVIADVVGKGVPASLLMMRLQGLFRETILANNDLSEVMTLVNRRLCENNTTNQFATAFLCALDVAQGELEYVNAGHDSPLIWQDGFSWLKTNPNLVLGALDSVIYEGATVQLQRGDSICFFTDGIPEAMDVNETLYGKHRIEELLTAKKATTAETIIEELTHDLQLFSQGREQFDDITLLAIGWNISVATLVLPPQVERLEELFSFLEPYTTRSGMTKRMMLDMMLVAEELFVNVCCYGFPKGYPKFPVVITVALDDEKEKLLLTMADCGIAYNPLDHEAVLVSRSKDNAIGGLGVHLVKESVNTITYERYEGKNILYLEKSYT